jgi:cellulose synthase operon protein C
MKAATAAAKEKKHDEVIALGKEAIEAYPDYVEGLSAYELVADALAEKGDKAGARKVLEAYANVGGRNPATLMKLAKPLGDDASPEAAIRVLEKLVYVYPLGEDLHKLLGDLYLTVGNAEGAVREFTALAGSNGIDQAGARFSLARALLAAKRTEEAKEQLLLSLEAAPGYKPAQRMLLELAR